MIQLTTDICFHAKRMVGSSPLEFIVIGLSSLARGETTPAFSDLEFAYIKEKNSEWIRLVCKTSHEGVLHDKQSGRDYSEAIVY